MKRVTVNLPDKTGQDLVALAESQKRTISAEAAVAIDKHLSDQSRKPTNRKRK